MAIESHTHTNWLKTKEIFRVISIPRAKLTIKRQMKFVYSARRIESQLSLNLQEGASMPGVLFTDSRKQNESEYMPYQRNHIICDSKSY